MLSEKVVSPSTISLNELFPNYTGQFVKPFEKVVDLDIHNGVCLDFELHDRPNKDKINPILRLARPEDAEEIVGIYEELYDGTYPYKEMEDVEEVRKMILEPSIQWIIYQDPSLQIAGCITFVLDFKNKRGYIRGFMLKKKYQGYIDITKAMIGSMLGMIHSFKNRIFTWYVENRTAHAKSQYSMWVCGIAPIGFYPNKDIFLGKVESDLMQVCYDERVLRKYRTREVPRILPCVEKAFQYSDNRYALGKCRVTSPDIKLNRKLILKAKRGLSRTIVKDRYGYETIRFTTEDSRSFFEFLYTPQVQNIEKTRYEVKSLEELHVFIEEFVRCGKELGVRYCEVFVSSYHPRHQKLFYDVGLCPRGYVPSWVYDQDKGVFKDNVLFSWFEGQVSKNIQLISEGKELLDVLGFEIQAIQKPLDRKKSILQKFPAFYTLKEKASKIWNFPKVVKSVLLIGTILYLSLLIGSVLVANSLGPRGYNFINNTVSQLGSSRITPAPALFDLACVFGGISAIIFYSYLSKRIKNPSFPSREPRKLVHRLPKYASFIGVTGSIGYLFVGVFSLDRSIGLSHVLSSIIAFGGFVLALFIFSFNMIRFYVYIPKIVALNGFLPVISFILQCMFTSPLFEWVLLISIITSLIPLIFWFSFR